jgi:uncharacterized membrane protein YebE (DUF533 family)
MTPYLNVVFPIIAIAGALGIFFASYRNAKKDRVENTQQKTIDAQNTQISLLKDRLLEVEKENTRVHLLLDTVISALKQDGKIITIDGNMITISDIGEDDGKSFRPRRKTTFTKAIQATTTVQESEKRA